MKIDCVYTMSENLEQQIKEQGEVVRKLKAAKAPKEKVRTKRNDYYHSIHFSSGFYKNKLLSISRIAANHIYSL